MVVLHVKRDQRSEFLADAALADTVDSTVNSVAELYNGRLKVLRLCDEVDALAEHGIRSQPEKAGLLEEQIRELKISDDGERDRCRPSAHLDNPDPTGRRVGDAPSKESKEKVLDRTVAEVRLRMNAEESVKSGSCLTRKAIKECLDVLKGAVSIVYPMGLPEYDPVRMELENREELDGTQAEKALVDPAEATLWFANKEMKMGNRLSDHLGKNEKTKVVVKLSTRRQGQPTSESWMGEEEQKRMMAENYKRMQEIRRLEKDDDDSYLNSSWADGSQLKKKFHGMSNISWK